MNWDERFALWQKENLPALTVRPDEEMRNYTSFRIGGPTRYMAWPESAQEIEQLLAFCAEEQVQWYVLGRGSNLLVSDAGLDALVINMGQMNQIALEDPQTITAGAGASLAKIAVFARDNGLGGFVFAHGIPGTLGGGLAMNAGAYGGEMKDVVLSVSALGANGVEILEPKELNFGYRHSIFSDSDRIALSARIRLLPEKAEKIGQQMEELMNRRRTSQPLEYPSAGSTFKRPEGNFAGTLIDQCGLKGTTVGGAQVSEKHAGFVINRGGASFDDVMTLIELVQDTVFRATGIELVPEVKILR